MIVKFNIKLSKIFIKDIGNMDKDKAMVVFFILMAVDMKDILTIIKSKDKESLWIKMEILNFSTFKKIDLSHQFLKEMWPIYH